MQEPKNILIIAGPNGAGKTTFAREYLLNMGGLLHLRQRRPHRGGVEPDTARAGSYRCCRPHDAGNDTAVRCGRPEFRL